MPAALRIFDVLAMSSTMNLANPSDVDVDGAAPSRRSAARYSGSAEIWATSCWIFAMIAGGVPAGAHKPYHAEISHAPQPASASVGTSGASGERSFPDTARSFTLPPA